MAKRKRNSSRRARYSREMTTYAPMMPDSPQENPMGAGTIIAIVAGLAAAGTLAYVMLKTPTPIAPASTARTSNGADNYQLTAVGPAGTFNSSSTGAYQMDIQTALLTSTQPTATVSSDGSTLTVTFTGGYSFSSIMNSAATQTSILNALNNPQGVSVTIVDTGIAVQ